MRIPKNAEERLALRPLHLPKEARPILEHTNGSAWYSYERAGKLYGMSFWGTGSKPHSHFRYSTEDRRNEAIQAFREAVERSLAHKAEDRAKKAAWVNPLKVGDVLYTSWGYDQTNVEFFAVTAVSGRRVHLREIAQHYTETGFMSGHTVPEEPVRFIGEELVRNAQPMHDGGVYVKINKSATAWLKKGDRTHYTSSYA